jgi:glycogen operon protein
MLAAGDELGHSQGGNNNAYCQDNPTSWIDWCRADDALVDYTRQLLQLRQLWRPLGDTWFDDGHAVAGAPELAWLQADGQVMDLAQWHDPGARALGLHVRRDIRPMLCLFNAGDTDLAFALPAGRWQPLIDSTGATPQMLADAQGSVLLAARSVLVLCLGTG